MALELTGHQNSNVDISLNEHEEPDYVGIHSAIWQIFYDVSLWYLYFRKRLGFV